MLSVVVVAAAAAVAGMTNFLTHVLIMSIHACIKVASPGTENGVQFVSLCVGLRCALAQSVNCYDGARLIL